MRPKTAANFILAQPRDLSYDEVVALGKKAGITFGPTYVGKIRRHGLAGANGRKIAELQAQGKIPVKRRNQGEKAVSRPAVVKEWIIDYFTKTPEASYAEVVSAGRKAGQKFTKSYVGAVRTEMKRRGPNRKGTTTAPAIRPNGHTGSVSAAQVASALDTLVTAEVIDRANAWTMLVAFSR